MAAVDAVVVAVSGEKLFDYWKRPNGGTVIFLRWVWVSAIIYVIALSLRSFFISAYPWCIDFWAFWHSLAETIPWLGAIFAAVYAALYARFASQWSYLAGEYNQIRQTMATWKYPSKNNCDHMNLWKAGFIEDAIDLHLATKPMFATFISRLLDDRAVVGSFDNITDKGPERRAQLEQRLRDMGIKDSSAKIAAGLVGIWIGL
jgi:hypothetical protein